jgi:hypothetical protein
MTMGTHLIDGMFKSDKYAWSPPGFVPLKLTDTTTHDLLWEYAQRRRAVDAEFADDLEAALKLAGYVHHPGKCLREVRPCTSDEAHAEMRKLQEERGVGSGSERATRPERG